MDYSDYQHILFERREHGIVWLTLNRPEALNAANRRLHTELVEVWRTLDRDPEARVAVVTGAGRAFSAGGDLGMVENAYRNPEEIGRILDEARDLVYNMLRCDKPIVSAINGPAVGAGLVVALLADISIAAESARLGDGHVRMGVAAGDHAAIIWPLLVGMARAKYYLMMAEFVDGREAERIGLVSLCVPDEGPAPRPPLHQAGTQPVAAPGRADLRPLTGPGDAGLLPRGHGRGRGRATGEAAGAISIECGLETGFP